MSDERRLKFMPCFVTIVFFAVVLGVISFVESTSENQGATMASVSPWMRVACPWDKEEIEAYKKEPEPKPPLVIMNCT